jgi:hypothetical protein
MFRSRAIIASTEDVRRRERTHNSAQFSCGAIAAATLSPAMKEFARLPRDAYAKDPLNEGLRAEAGQSVSAVAPPTSSSRRHGRIRFERLRPLNAAGNC